MQADATTDFRTHDDEVLAPQCTVSSDFTCWHVCAIGIKSLCLHRQAWHDDLDDQVMAETDLTFLPSSRFVHVLHGLVGCLVRDCALGADAAVPTTKCRTGM